MVLYEIGEEIRPIFQQSGKIRIARRKFANYQLKEVLIKIDKLYQVFNMENKTLKKTNIKIIPYYYLPSADGLRIVWIVKDEVTVSELIDGRLTIEKVWYPPIEGFKIYRVFSSGIAVYNHKALEVYWFPES